MPAHDFHVHVDPDELTLGELSRDPATAAGPQPRPGRPGRAADTGRARPVRTAAAGQSRRYAFRRS